MKNNNPASLADSDRYRACALLRSHGVPCVVWFEDAIAYHGAPVVLFDLHILVPEIELADLCLQHYGWIPGDSQAKVGNASVHCRQGRLGFPPNGRTADDSSTQDEGFDIVLLQSKDWNFAFDDAENAYIDPSTSPYPHLGALLDGLIGSLLDCPEQNVMLQRHLAAHVCYIYDHAPRTQPRNFAEQLKYEHRQYHHDVLSGIGNGTASFIHHERKVRDLLRKGLVKISDCSTPRDQDLPQGGKRRPRLLQTIDEEGNTSSLTLHDHSEIETVEILFPDADVQEERFDVVASRSGKAPIANDVTNAEQYKPERPTVAQVRAACAAVAQCLNHTSIYAVLGGAACQLLGSRRMTDDVDIVVPQGTIAHTRAQLALDKVNFTVESRTRYTNFICDPPINIQILAPPGLFKESFDADTAIHEIMVMNTPVKVLHPGLVINSKCRSIVSRVTNAKTASDAADIIFLLQWIVDHQFFPTDFRISNASETFINSFVVKYGGEEYWKRVKRLGYC